MFHIQFFCRKLFEEFLNKKIIFVVPYAEVVSFPEHSKYFIMIKLRTRLYHIIINSFLNSPIEKYKNIFIFNTPYMYEIYSTAPNTSMKGTNRHDPLCMPMSL